MKNNKLLALSLIGAGILVFSGLGASALTYISPEQISTTTRSGVGTAGQVLSIVGNSSTWANVSLPATASFTTLNTNTLNATSATIGTINITSLALEPLIVGTTTILYGQSGATSTIATPLVITGSSVGIGTTTTLYKLDVNGTFRAGASQFDGAVTGIALNEIENLTANKTFTMGANDLTFNFTTPSEGLTLNATGAFGDHLLHLHQYTGNPGQSQMVHIEADDDDVLPIDIVHTGTPTYGYLQIGSVVGDGGTKFKINSSGNVGIGTTNPTQKLNVVGNVSSTGLIVAGTATTTNLINTGQVSSTNAFFGIATTTNLINTGQVSSTNALFNTATTTKLVFADGTTQTTAASGSGGGKLAQVVYAASSTVNQMTNPAFPWDDTIPQNSEGAQIMSVTITPTNASSRLLITMHGSFYASAGTFYSLALFQDATANALATSYAYESAGGGSQSLQYSMIAGTTSATTFYLRAGCRDACTLTFNGESGNAKYGGTIASTIIIQEITP